MNILSFVFSILLILSLGTLAMREKQGGDRRIRSTYLGHIKASRKILARNDLEAYKTCGTTKKPANNNRTPRQEQTTRQPAKPPKINPECARLNLWPLIQEGREEQQLLYDLAAGMIKTFYSGPLFDNKAGAETHFFDAFLKRAKEQQVSFSLEKLNFGDPKLQGIYYKMLKGSQGQYPSFLDMVRIDEAPSKVCLHHAHPQMIAVFFGEKAATKLFEEIHQEKAPPITQELIEKICFESHTFLQNSALLELLELGRPHKHPKASKTTWIAEDQDSNVSLRKNIYAPS